MKGMGKKCMKEKGVKVRKFYVTNEEASRKFSMAL
jgi:hypothetical protein